MAHIGNPIADFIYHFFQQPIIDRTGYNPVNTLAYAILALLGIYAIWRLFQKYQVTIDRRFLMGVLAFVLFGSTVRIITDMSDHPGLWSRFPSISPLHAWVHDVGIYNYDAYIIPTPGIYIVTAALFLVSFLLLRAAGRLDYLAYVGLALWFPHFLVLLPFLGRFAIHAVPVVVLAALPAYYIHRKYQNIFLTLVQAAHSFDGAATFYAIDLFGRLGGVPYGEQHVVGGFIGTFFGTYFAFYVLKTLLAYFIADALHKEGHERGNENYSNYIALVVIIVGLAPGLRDVLRMMAGV